MYPNGDARPKLADLTVVLPASTTAAAVVADLDGLCAMLPPAFTGPRGKLQAAGAFVIAQADRIAELEGQLALRASS